MTAEPTDFTITLSESSFSPGDYTLVAEQRGQTPHALSIAGPGVDGTTPVIQPDGGNQELTVSLPAGSSNCGVRSAIIGTSA